MRFVNLMVQIQSTQWFGIALLIAATLSSFATSSAADGKQTISNDRVYLALLHRNAIELPFGGALFCPAKGMEFASCRPKNGYVLGAFGWNVAADWYTNRPRKTPKMMFDGVKVKRMGRHVMVAGSSGSNAVRMNNVTYYFDAEPGTVFVIPMLGQSMDDAITSAKQILIDERSEKDVSALIFKPIKAAQFTCDGRKPAKCRLTKDIDPRKIGRKF